MTVVIGVALVATALAVPRAAQGAPAAVALVAASNSRFADELARELEASRFAVIRVAVAVEARDAVEAAPHHVPRVVVVAGDARRVTVVARAARSGELGTSVDLHLDPRDPVVRRRACLTVVEYLHVMSSSATVSTPAAHPSAARSRPVPADDDDEPTDAVSTPSRQAATASDPAAVATMTAAPALPSAERRPWIMGAAITADLNTGLGESTSHFLFVWEFPLAPQLAIRALALWPLLGASFDDGGAHVRLWTFGTGVGLNYAFLPRSAPVHPFVGATLGLRFTLIETTAMAPDNDTSTVTPSVNAGLRAGLSCRLARFAELFVDSGVTRDHLLPGFSRTGLSATAASAVSFDSSVGALFEY